MRLFIAEKPSLGRAIADVLKKPLKKQEGYIESASGDVVTWCIGHLLEQEEPDAYDPAYKTWKLEHLPIVPMQWKLRPRKGGRGQLSVINKLLKRADIIVNAGDPDREGQLLVDEVLDYLKLSAQRKKDVRRLLISDLNPSAVSQALGRMRSNQEFVPLAVSALARSRADWLYGINLTRACTLLGRKVGFNGLLSIGRVQTPILGLVARRDAEIEHFQPKPYFEVFATLLTAKEETFKAKWLPSEACQNWMDEEGRVLDRRLAQNVVDRITGKQGTVKRVEDKRGKEPPPLPYSLSALQIDAARQLRMDAKTVLDSCQRLYEQKLITYPRSDCRYLPEEHLSQAPEVLATIRHNVSSLGKAVDQALPERKTSAWNDKKVGAHHGIIPTSLRTDLERLSELDRKLYGLIARQYVAQFYPDHTFRKRVVDIDIEKGLFRAGSRQTVEEGWKVLMNSGKSHQRSAGDENGENNEESTFLPELAKGDVLDCPEAELKEKMTQPPKPFNDATLLSAMTGIARFVQDKDIRKILRETDGLGTEATRASIIELLFKRQFLERKGRSIHATATGRALVNALPERVTTPDMTARWEASLNDIVERKGSYGAFMGGLDQELRALLMQTMNDGLPSVAGLPAPSNQPFKRKGKAKSAGSRRKKRSPARS
ncbi:DNA topoisomerase III [Thalassotalea sp. G20_0]|uniref:DNA topoisomerase III n=1 Tax=Thalassotalea sp. G20_0 TaxID=2821093 RepID=UPI001ADA0BE7|nr:DNA topoisomerase III [Thalassotalea sp. G20_0]MBO9492983.1 DNA topoisomerase III [Thalassotalea sp. G20_0]